MYKKLQAAVLAGAILLPPAATASANDWSKPDSRTKGTVIGAVAGALVGGKKGAVVGAALGNGVQQVRHKQHKKHRRHRQIARHRHRSS